jgi:ribosome-binding protein aMBF1 (putative translation factor)
MIKKKAVKVAKRAAVKTKGSARTTSKTASTKKVPKPAPTQKRKTAAKVKPNKLVADTRKRTKIPKQFFDINYRFMEFRKMKGMTQDDFANSIGVTLSYISNLEAHQPRFTASIHAIRQLRKVFGVSYDWIIDGVGKPVTIG